MRSWLSEASSAFAGMGSGLPVVFYCLPFASGVNLHVVRLGLSPVVLGGGVDGRRRGWGKGTIFLLVRRGSIARNSMMALSLVSLMTFIWMFITPLTPSLPWRLGQDIVVLTDEIMPPFSGSVRAFVPITNGMGTLMLVGGALWSARLFASKQIMQNRVIGNALIALGECYQLWGATSSV
ncbi:MAG UNVERIFIED_CONTAM: hypothetical protein LVT10_22530 [Anaerolineae bacterium]